MNAMPQKPKQVEMPGMVEGDAAKILHAEKRRIDAKKEKISKEDLFDFDLQRYKMPKYERNFHFALHLISAEHPKGRKWRFDFAWPKYKVAVEIEGLVVQRVHIATLDENGRVVKTEPQLVTRGRHANVAGYREDCDKYNAAVADGWRVLRFEQTQVRDGVAIDGTQRLLIASGWNR